MKRSDAYTSNWLKAKDLLEQGRGNGLDLTIKASKLSEMDDGAKQVSLSFDEDERALGLNATNFDSLVLMTGKDDSDDWAGMVINVFPHQLDRPYNGATHGIRVRAPRGVGPAKSNVRTAPAAGNALVEARNAAFTALKLISAPDISREEITKAWAAVILKTHPGRKQSELTAGDWESVKAQIEGYSGEAAPDWIPADLPF